MRRYVEVWSSAGARTLLLSGIIGRLPISMVPLALLLLVEDATGSYAAAGLATALYGVATALVAPFLGRFADRRGPRAVLYVTGMGYPLAIAGLVAAITTGLPMIVVYLTAVLAGFLMPLVSSTVRALWPRVTTGRKLTAAYALDSISVETVFVLGPTIVALSASVTTALVPLAVAAVMSAAGSFWLAGSGPARRWKPAAGSGKSRFLGPLALPGIPKLLVAGGAFSLSLGIVEVALPAYSESVGMPILSGILLAVWSVGSAVGGLWFGTRQPMRSLASQYRWGLLLSAIGLAPLALAASPWLVGIVLAVGGASVAPTVTVQNSLVAALVPARLTTEAFTWVTTVVFGASALGAAVGGLVVDGWGIPAAFGASAVVMLTGAGIFSLRRRSRLRAPAPIEAVPVPVDDGVPAYSGQRPALAGSVGS